MAAIDLIEAGGVFKTKLRAEQVQSKCERCGFMTSQKLCQACVLLDGLNRRALQRSNTDGRAIHDQ